jgi:hypothetical protein
MGGFIEVGLSRGYSYTQYGKPLENPEKILGEWDYRTRTIPLSSSMKLGHKVCKTSKKNVTRIFEPLGTVQPASFSTFYCM